MNEANAQRAFNRLRRGFEPYEDIQRYQPIPDPIGVAYRDPDGDKRLAAFRKLEQVYGLRNFEATRAYREDLSLLRKVLMAAAHEVGAQSHLTMRRIRGQMISDYLEGDRTEDGDPLTAEPLLTSFARSLASYVVAKSDAPYPYLSEDLDKLPDMPPEYAAVSTLPAGPPATPPPSTRDEILDAGVSQDHNDFRFPTYAWGDWKPDANPTVRYAYFATGVNDGEQLKAATLTREQRPPPHAAGVRYQGHPLVLLAGRLRKPEQLYLMLRAPPRTRNEQLRGLVEDMDRYLLTGQKAFLRSFTDGEWDTLEPLLHTAKWMLFPDAHPPGGPKTGPDTDRPLHKLCNRIIDDLQPWSIFDTIFAVSLVASVALTLVSFGTYGPVAVVTLRVLAGTVEVAGFAADLIAADAENEQRARINRFAAVDRSLELARRPESLAARAAIGALALLIPVAVGGAVQKARRSMLKRSLQRIDDAGVPKRVPISSGSHIATAAAEPPMPRPDLRAPPPAPVEAASAATPRTLRSTSEGARGAGPAARGTGPEAKRTSPAARGTAPEAQGTTRAVLDTAPERPLPGTTAAAPPRPPATGRVADPPARRGPGRSAPAPVRVPNSPGSGKRFVDAADYGILDPRSARLLTDFDRRIAGTGGIRRIVVGQTADGRFALYIEGEVLPQALVRDAGPLLPGQARAPSFNSLVAGENYLGPIKGLVARINGRKVSLANRFQRLHLIGPGTGDEAAAGLWLGEISVNLSWQNSGIEATMREFATTVRSRGGRLGYRVTGETWDYPTPAGFSVDSGERALQRAQYDFWVEAADGTKTSAVVVTLDVPDPGYVIKAIEAGRPPPAPEIDAVGELYLPPE